MWLNQAGYLQSSTQRALRAVRAATFGFQGYGRLT
jgi:hypothetical protein